MSRSEHTQYIDGAWSQGNATRQLDVANPATGESIAVFAESSSADIDAAVRSAAAAFRTWRHVNPHRRATWLQAMADAIEARLSTIASTMTREQGKPLSEAEGEVGKLVKTLRYYAGEAVRVCGQIIPNEDDGFQSQVEHEPIGVAAAITPWNYPAELIGWKLGAALAAGCTLVIKPSEYTPLTAVEIVRAIDEAGLPNGVVNLVQGAGEVGGELVRHPAIDKIAFTGSHATGLRIYETMGRIKSVSLELGGNCPLIVAASADLEAAVAGAVRRSFRNMGQICIAINRAYVHRSLYDEFLVRVAEATGKLRIGDGLADPGVDLGPMTNAAGLAKVEAHVKDALDRGARLICGAKAPDNRGGLFYEPTVLADCDADMRVMRDETFGPVLGVATFDDLDTVIEHVNDSPYGLAAYAYATDLTEVYKLSRGLSFGSVAMNCVDAGIINAPYGGRRQSGVGYEHGRAGLDGYLLYKHVRIKHGVQG
ncbi:aldehyde dehydrogenase family protein [Salinisphaera hydrothermalis]|uniref:aldehyde dehydrogenase family protein n=1 Tax=Salinisphaera hydrothermalis TaxID=563188 RepID=UPI003340444C